MGVGGGTKYLILLIILVSLGTLVSRMKHLRALRPEALAHSACGRALIISYIHCWSWLDVFSVMRSFDLALVQSEQKICISPKGIVEMHRSSILSYCQFCVRSC